MKTWHLPVLLWQDRTGVLTAQLVGDREGSAVAASDKAALRQLKEYVRTRVEADPWYQLPQLEDPELRLVEVSVRPAYQQADRVYPCAENVRVEVALVVGEHSSGMRLALAPRLGIHFFHHARDSLPALVQHYVRDALRGGTPADLAGVLPPEGYRLETLVLRLPTPREEDRVPPPPTLSRVAEHLASPAMRRSFPPPYEREADVEDLARRLGRERASVLLVGEPGVGKTAVLAEAARRLELARAESEGVPRRARFWLTSGHRLVAGMRYLGQWEERCEAAVAEVQGIDGVLCVENLRELVHAGGAVPGAGIGAFLVPYLRAGELRLVAEATPAELDACRRVLPELVELLQVVRLEELDAARAQAALGALVAAREGARGPRVEPEVPGTVYRLFRRFRPYEVFPGRAAEFVNELWTRARTQGVARVGPPEVLARFGERTGLPEVFLRDDLPLPREEVEAALRARVVGQEAAVQAVARRVLAFKAGLNDPGRPLGVLLLCGPTGVGKTQLARTLARFVFGAGEDARRLIRLDMSEYATPGSAARLTLGPDGGPSETIAKVRRQPFVVLLLDEIEKAAPEVFDVLLTVLDEGRLVDSDGRVAVFRSAFVLMTSNLGAGSDAAIGFGGEGRPAYAKHVRDFFRPEFVNRIDEVVVFDALTPEAVRAVAALELAELAGREGFAARGLRLAWSEAVLDLVAREGFERLYGARPLQRAVERLVATPLAHLLVARPELRDRELTLEVEGGVVRVAGEE